MPGKSETYLAIGPGDRPPEEKWFGWIPSSMSDLTKELGTLIAMGGNKKVKPNDIRVVYHKKAADGLWLSCALLSSLWRRPSAVF